MWHELDIVIQHVFNQISIPKHITQVILTLFSIVKFNKKQCFLSVQSSQYQHLGVHYIIHLHAGVKLSMINISLVLYKIHSI